MSSLEKLKALLDEELITKEEYELWVKALPADKAVNAEVEAKVETPAETEVKDEKVPNEVKEPVKTADAHPQIEGDEPKEKLEEIKEEAKTETLADEAKETPQEQAAEENTLIEAADKPAAEKVEDLSKISEKCDELEKANAGYQTRLEALEKQVAELLAADPEPEHLGVSPVGKVGVNEDAYEDYQSEMMRKLSSHR